HNVRHRKSHKQGKISSQKTRINRIQIRWQLRLCMGPRLQESILAIVVDQRGADDLSDMLLGQRFFNEAYANGQPQPQGIGKSFPAVNITLKKNIRVSK